jgi:hypothetical protein
VGVERVLPTSGPRALRIVARQCVVLAGVLAALCLVAPASARAACGWSGYSYAGVESSAPAHGIAATLSMLSAPVVENGHVAAWVGVGGSGAGPGSTGGWIQVGLSGFPGLGSRLYYEVARAGRKPSYIEVIPSVSPLERHRVAVLELAGRRGWWRAWVDGRPVGPAVHLHGARALQPMATAESWDGGLPSCNRYAYLFDRISVAAAPGGAWRSLSHDRVFQDPGYRVVSSSAGRFVATRSHGH